MLFGLDAYAWFAIIYAVIVTIAYFIVKNNLKKAKKQNKAFS